jgi:uncharacterized protein (DUF427 family)
VLVGDKVEEDLVWSYQTPIPEAEGIAGLMCFYNERIDLSIGGEPPAGRQGSSSR